MRRFLFGFDAERPEECARALRDAGFDGVVISSANSRAADALEAAGLELYLCFGALGLGGLGRMHMATDALGRKTAWFGSGCPSDDALIEGNLNRALETLLRTKTAKGLFADGARHASFASGEGEDAFFTCFCPTCMSRMERAGFDAPRIKRAVQHLMTTRRISDAAALSEWFRWREYSVKTWFDHFSQAVRALGKAACAFVFALSLANFVGQTSKALSNLDILSPMLYRAYPHPEGTAALGHEWGAARRMFGGALSELCALAGTQAPEEDAAAGFPPGRIGQETRAASHTQRLLPILQIEDERFLECARSALSAGADGFGAFMYGQAELPDILEV